MTVSVKAAPSSTFDTGDSEPIDGGDAPPSSNALMRMPVLPGEIMMQCNMDYDSIMKAGSYLGSGAVIVMDDSRCMVESLLRLSYFYMHESCGQCTPCREGTGWLYRMVHRIEHGEGRMEDLDLLLSVGDNIAGRTICALGEAAVWPVQGMLRHFRDEFEYHIEHKRCLV